MSDDDWLKKLLMLPAQLAVDRQNRETRIDHAHREKLGTPAKRASCCGPRPPAYPEGQRVEDIPELRELQRTSWLMRGYMPYFCCKVCGQEWYQDWEQQKFGGLIQVRKARLGDRFRGEGEIRNAFREASRMKVEAITSGSDDERRHIAELLRPYTASEVPAELLAEYPLSTMFPMLSPAAYRYYMPRCIEYCFQENGSLLCESLIYSLANARVDRVARFTPPERRLVQELIEYFAELPDAQAYAAHLRDARAAWA